MPDATPTTLLRDAVLMERDFSTEQRKAYAVKGIAMADGSYPIPDVDALERAIKAYGRSPDAATKRHIMKRARALGRTDLLPENWTEAAASDVAEAGGPMCTMATCAPDCPPECSCCVGAGQSVPACAVCRAAECSCCSSGMMTAMMAEAAHLDEIIEAGDQPQGTIWGVTLIAAGDSANGRRYPAEVLQRAAPLFEGAKAYADHPSRAEARDRPERSVRDLVGWFQEAAYDAGAKAVRAKLHLSEAADGLRRLMLDAWQRGKSDLLGLSINAEGQVQEAVEGGKRVRLVNSIDRVHSVDLVTEPAAGGRLEALVASTRADETESTTLAGGDAGAATEENLDMTITLDDIRSLMAEAIAPIREEVTTLRATVTEVTTTAATDTAASGTDDATAQRLQEVERRFFDAELRAALLESKLPEKAQARVRRLFESRMGTAEEVATAIREEREYVAAIIPTPMRQFGTVHQGEGASVTEDAKTKWLQRFEGSFDLGTGTTKLEGMRPFTGLREAYSAWRELKEGRYISYAEVDPLAIFEAMRPRRAGELDHAPRDYLAYQRGAPLQDAIRDRLLESILTTDWTQVYADVQYRMLIRAYNEDALYNEWRAIVSNVESVPDFQTRHWLKVGGFANLAAVSQGATYPNLTSPTDTEITYAVGKFGGVHDTSLEAVVNDQWGALRSIPLGLARSAKRTLYRDILDLVTTDNPTMDDDSTALYAAGHSNTGTNALSVSGLAAVWRAMRDQTPYGESAAILGMLNTPRFLIVPNELEQVANRIIGGTSPNYQFALSSTPDADASIDPLYFHGKGLQSIVYDHMTDATDWFAVADPQKVATVVVGFLGGNDQPELLVQDSPTTGSVFTADKITTRVRMIYGFDVLEWRSFYRQVVGG